MSGLLGALLIGSMPVQAYGNNGCIEFDITSEDVCLAVGGVAAVGAVCAGVYGIYKLAKWAQDYHIRCFCADFKAEVDDYLVRNTDQFSITRTCCLGNKEVEVTVLYEMGDFCILIAADHYSRGRETCARLIKNGRFPSEWIHEIITKLVNRW